MNVKIEVLSGNHIKDLNRKVEMVLEVVPQEHLRGLSKIVLVDTIMEPRLSPTQRATLPALYHPKMAGQSAWAEVSLSVLAPKEKFPKRLLTRLALKSNLAQVVLSLVAQHYQLTLSKGVKKTLLEPAIKSYVERHFEKWREKQGGLRVRLLKPFKPQLDKLARKLAKRYRAELAKK
ncbi:MAG: hypothetical protein AABO57_01660 [Acidobacteriota bacterium]